MTLNCCQTHRNELNSSSVRQYLDIPLNSEKRSEIFCSCTYDGSLLVEVISLCQTQMLKFWIQYGDYEPKLIVAWMDKTMHCYVLKTANPICLLVLQSISMYLAHWYGRFEKDIILVTYDSSNSKQKRQRAPVC